MREVLGRRGIEFILYELLANAWDEPQVTLVNVTIHDADIDRLCAVTVEDNSPQGWDDAGDAFTLFAPSKKRGGPALRGRFNLGEKLAVSMARSAWVETMKGTIAFREDGSRTWNPKQKRVRGTQVSLVMQLTKQQVRDLVAASRRVIPPASIQTVVNGVMLTRPPELRTLNVT